MHSIKFTAQRFRSKVWPLSLGFREFEKGLNNAHDGSIGKWLLATIGDTIGIGGIFSKRKMTIGFISTLIQ